MVLKSDVVSRVLSHHATAVAAIANDQRPDGRVVFEGSSEGKAQLPALVFRSDVTRPRSHQVGAGVASFFGVLGFHGVFARIHARPGGCCD